MRGLTGERGRVPKLAIVFFGMARNTRRTIGAIRSRIYRPNQHFAAVRIASLNELDAVTNERSGELGVVLDRNDKYLLECDEYINFEQDLHDTDQYMKIVQRQPDVYQDHWRTAQILMYQLLSLRRAWRHIEETEAGKADYYAFLRPDLLYLDRLDLTQVIGGLARPNSVAIPPWQPYGGLNDRFAVADAIGARHYAQRIDRIGEYVDHLPLHAERLLRFAMTVGGCHVVPLPVRARRVRADGRVVAEDFTPQPLALGMPTRPPFHPSPGGSGVGSGSG
jgi:hypothetical protein